MRREDFEPELRRRVEAEELRATLIDGDGGHHRPRSHLYEVPLPRRATKVTKPAEVHRPVA
jgi:hypothetical protein